MKVCIRFFLMVGLLGMLAGCGGKEGYTGGTGVDSLAAKPAPAADVWLKVAYDDLRLRSAAGMKAEVLATLKSGEQVKDLGEWSKDIETVELRGERITAPWGKVEMKDGKQGWIFLGALTPVLDPVVADLEKALEGLDRSKCASIAEGMKLYSEKMKGKSAWVADQGVPALEAFIFQTVEQVNNDLFARPDFEGYDNMLDQEGNAKKGTKAEGEIAAWKACGLHLEFPEGMMMIESDAGLIDATVGPLGTEAMKKYLAQRKKEKAEGWSEDAGLMITPQQLAERAVYWDDFLLQYPTFISASAIRNLAHRYVIDLLIGENNTPAIEYEGQLNNDFKAAYEWVLKNHANSETAHWVKEWYDLLKANGLKNNAKTEAYAQKLLLL